MASITQKISNYLGGVSTQPDDKKLPGQLRECINAYPDPINGLTKRPGFKFIGELGTGLDSGRWFYINRDEDEIYLGVIYDSTIKIVNTLDGTLCTINNNAAGGGGTFTTSSYLTVAATPEAEIRDALRVLTVQDTTIITNRSVTAAALDPPTGSDVTKATIRLRSAAYGTEYKVVIVHAATTYTYILTTRNSDTLSTPPATPAKLLNAEDILTALNTGIPLPGSSPDTENTTGGIAGFGIPDLTITQLDASLEITCPTAFTITTVGGQDSDLLTSFTNQVASVADLPTQSVQGRVTRIANTITGDDSYWAKFVANNGSEGGGYWEETVDPTVSTGLNPETMPHELVNTGLNQFSFGPIEWAARAVGDDTTNPQPSFVGQTINNAFFYSNRLGFLSKDNVILSQANDFYNFYFVSALTATAKDPIDLSTASVRPTTLYSVQPAPQGLVLFSEQEQFLMAAENGNLQPATTSIRSLANYNCDKDLDPVTMGIDIMFVSKTNGYTRIFSMLPRGQQEPPSVVAASKVVDQYIPSDVDQFFVSSQNSFIGVASQASKSCYFYRTYSTGERDIMQAWYRWDMPGNVQFMEVDKDNVVCVVKMDNGQFVLINGDLNQSPEETIIVNNDGKLINPSVDLYALVDPQLDAVFPNLPNVTYDPVTRESTVVLPYTDDETLTPVLLIAGNISDSGFTIEPTRSSPVGSFIVPNKDLTEAGVVDNIVVGYTYNYDVSLPRLYVTGENGSDYTAVLTVNRMKFSFGLSGAGQFIVNSVGRDEWSVVEPVTLAGIYQADDAPISEQNLFVIPINQRNTNFYIRVFSDSPFPLSLTSMAWEGNYVPKHYRRV